MAVVPAAAAAALAAAPCALMAAFRSVHDNWMVQPTGVVATAGVGQEIVAVGFGRRPLARKPDHCCRSKAATWTAEQDPGFELQRQVLAVVLGTPLRFASTALVMAVLVRLAGGADQ